MPRCARCPGALVSADSRRGIRIAALAAMTSAVRFGQRGAGSAVLPVRCVRPFDSSDRRILNAQPQAHCDSARRTGAGRYPVQRLPWHDDASAAGVAWVRTSGVSSGLRPVSWHGVTYRRNDGRGALRQTWSGLGRRAGATRQAIWPPRPSYLQCAPASALRFRPSYRRRPVPRAAFEVAQRAGRPAPRAPRRRISPAASARLQLRARTRPDSGR